MRRDYRPATQILEEGKHRRGEPGSWNLGCIVTLAAALLFWLGIIAAGFGVYLLIRR